MDERQEVGSSHSDPGDASCHGQPLLGSRKSRILERGHYHLCLWLLLLELANVLLFGGGYAILARATRSSYEQHDSYEALSRYSITNKFEEGSRFSDESWEELKVQFGIVSLSEAWVARHGIPPSRPTPNAPGEMAYQIDGFHSLHCLYRIRQHLVARETDSSQVDGHTIHCLDYVRQALMCNIDLMLGATRTYEDFGANGTHVCRDYDAVIRWVQANQWKGFFEWSLRHQKDLASTASLLDKSPKSVRP